MSEELSAIDELLASYFMVQVDYSYMSGDPCAVSLVLEPCEAYPSGGQVHGYGKTFTEAFNNAEEQINDDYYE